MLPKESPPFPRCPAPAATRTAPATPGDSSTEHRAAVRTGTCWQQETPFDTNQSISRGATAEAPCKWALKTVAFRLTARRINPLRRESCSLAASALPPLSSLQSQRANPQLHCQTVHTHLASTLTTPALPSHVCPSLANYLPSSARTPDSGYCWCLEGFSTPQNSPGEKMPQTHTALSLISYRITKLGVNCYKLPEVQTVWRPPG